MTSTNEVGISPVLLQAISQTLNSSSKISADGSGKSGAGEGSSGQTQQIIVSDGDGGFVIRHAETSQHILHGLNEPMGVVQETTEETPGDGTVIYVQNVPGEEPREVVVESQSSEDCSNVYVMSQDGGGSGGANNAVTQPQDNISMGNVLSAIASHLRTNRQQHASESEINTETNPESQQQHQYIIVNNHALPHAVQDVTISETGTVLSESLEGHSEKRHIFSSGGTEVSSSSGSGEVLLGNSEGMAFSEQHPASYTIETSSSSAYAADSERCPICGDRISGYHYGIYTCESCKGFFKRTVQNKKTFVCHRRGECGVGIGNRKKCPACRFQKCLLAGMRLEAIRCDRTRGGRSSYDGCSPHGRPKPAARQIVKVRVMSQDSFTNDVVPIQNPPAPVHIPKIPKKATTETVKKTIVEPAKQVHTKQVNPTIPELVMEVMAIESLLSEEEHEQSCCEGKFVDGDPDLFGSLLHLTDHCLYKIVRWARNLPDFTTVSTDDQILLLQNCWAELLCLNVCWHSISDPTYIHLAAGRVLNIEKAAIMGIDSIISRMLSITEVYHRLELDQFEFVCLKVLILMTPDVKGLKDIDKIREFQDRMTEALLVYTTTHYPKFPNKFGELLLKLPEVARTCLLAKDILNEKLKAGEIAPFSLLSELLKGDQIHAAPLTASNEEVVMETAEETVVE